MSDEPVPRYQQVKRELRAAIGRGEYVTDQPFISQRGVCERFGVSTTTAIRALNDLVTEGVLVRRQGRGTFVAEQVSSARESVPARRERTSVACVIHGQGPIKANVIAGVEAVCSELGIELVLFNSRDSLVVQEQALRRAMESGVSGVVLYAVQGSGESEALAALRRRVPVVLVDRYLPSVATDAVTVDHFAVGYELAERLIAEGHERMALLWNETDCTSVRDRLSGHLQALRSHGIEERPDLTVLTAHHRLERPARIARLESMLSRPDAPTVLIGSDGYVVATAAADLASLGIDVPGRVELAGMDDAGPLDILPLTVAAAVVPAEEMGREGMRLLAARLDGSASGPPRRVVLPITLHARDTTRGYLRVVAGQNG
jgi:DNA-binding LacI/PurR family transcriptional regulator